MLAINIVMRQLCFTVIFQTGPYLIGLGGFLTAILCLVSLLPLGSLCVRRLHDTGRGSMSLLLFLIPFVGPLILLLLLCQKGQQQDNQYGSALKHIVIDARLASIMKVSPTSSSLTTRVLIVVLVTILCVFGFSLRTMGPENEVFPSGWFTNAIVGEGMVEAKPMKRYISLIEENGAWHIEAFYKHLPDDDK